MRGVSIRTILGVLALFVGIAAIFVPDLAALLPFAPTIIDALGALLVGLGVWVAQKSIRTERTTPDPPVPETRADLPAPGEEFDVQLAQWAGEPWESRKYDQWREVDEQVRTRLRSIAVRLLRERYSMSESEAQAALDDGTWTDDPETSDFFVGDTGKTVTTDMQVSDFVPLGRLSGPTRAERVITELDEIARGEDESRPATAGESDESADTTTGDEQ